MVTKEQIKLVNDVDCDAQENNMTIEYISVLDLSNDEFVAWHNWMLEVTYG